MVSVGEISRPIAVARSRRSFLLRTLGRQEFWRGLVAIIVFLVLWEIGSRSKEWFGHTLPYVGLLPPPSDVAVAWSDVLMKWGYWESWYKSFGRVLTGFIAAQIIGIPFGLMLAVNKYFRDIFFPPFEVLRPIPPLAWVPASLIFWPTNEMSIAFVTFLGAFFTIVINVLGGARNHGQEIEETIIAGKQNEQLQCEEGQTRELPGSSREENQKRDYQLNQEHHFNVGPMNPMR